MDNREVEMARFKAKAHGYRAAHEIAPMARILEVSAIVNVIEGFRKKHHIPKSELVIVDLMAGTGFLSKSLYRAGYRNLHAFEACNDMSQKTFGRSDSDHYALHPFADIFGITPLLKQVRPHIIICLAGFHHLIEFCQDGSVNEKGSVDIQERVVKVCMDALADDGMLLLADIHEDGFGEFGSSRWPYWEGRTSLGKKLYKASHVPPSVREILVKSDSPQSYSATVESRLANGRKENPALVWFRSVIDTLSTAGHKDIPLTKALACRLEEKYKVSTTSFSCPWIFPSRASLDNFLLTFWFDDVPRDSTTIPKVLTEAETINGIYVNGTFASFGWNLGFIAIESKTPTGVTMTRGTRRRLFWLFLCLFLLCGTTIALKTMTYSKAIYEVLDYFIMLLLGAVANEFFSEWRRR